MTVRYSGRTRFEVSFRWLFDNVDREYALDVVTRNAENLLKAAE